jgi:hypothetical protein
MASIGAPNNQKLPIVLMAHSNHLRRVAFSQGKPVKTASDGKPVAMHTRLRRE